MKNLSHREQRRRTASLGLFAACFLAIGTHPAGAAPFELPAINVPASNEHHVGKVIWHDLRTTDLSHAKEFYAAMFGWHFRDYHAAGIDYALAMYGGHPVAGLLQRSVQKGEERRSSWLPFLAVRDVDAAVRNALLHHAMMRSDAEDHPLRGRQALLSDPEGVTFAIEASSSGDPPDAIPAPGNWLGTSLYARDPADAAVFYQQVFGYDLVGLPADGGFERVRLNSGDQVRVRVNALSTDAPALGAGWISFVRVVDAADATARAIELGGQVLVKTRRDTQGVTTVILADPTGAPFGVAELPQAQAAAGSS
jgi:predicted enzyme related to lactoylglutathione lyase